MSSLHLTTWHYKMFKLNSKLIEDKWNQFKNHTKLKKELLTKKFKINITNHHLTNILAKLDRMIHTNNMANPSHKSIKWSKKIKKKILNKLFYNKCGKKNLIKTLKLHNTPKSINNILFKKMPKISCTALLDKISLNGINLLNLFLTNQ